MQSQTALNTWFIILLWFVSNTRNLIIGTILPAFQRTVIKSLLYFASLTSAQSSSNDPRRINSIHFPEIGEQSANSIFSVLDHHYEKAGPAFPRSNIPNTGKSRRITLPDDYNKLEVPKLRNVKPEAVSRYGLEAWYNRNKLPQNGNDVLPIEVDVTVRKIRNVDEIKEEISVELDFSAKWLDYVILLENDHNFVTRYAFDGEIFTKTMKSLDSAFLRRIWKPDLFIEDISAISRDGILSAPVRLLFSPSGFIIFSTRITVKLNCVMDFRYYPADIQICPFRIRSYSYTTSDLNITWGKPGPFLIDRSDENFHVKLDLVDSMTVVESEGTLHHTYQELYTVLQFNICARRQLSYHLMQTYLPSIFFIAITWLSFLVPVTMVEARIGISMTTLLTLTSMFAAVRESTPTVSYIKAIDIWMVACIFFVFLTLLELTVLSCRRHMRAAAAAEAAAIADEEPDYAEPVDKIQHKHSSGTIKRRRNRRRRFSTNLDEFLEDLTDEKIEKYAFFGFLLLFILFNLIYWPWLFLASEYLKWDVDYVYNSKNI